MAQQADEGWWIEQNDDGDLTMREQFADRKGVVAFVRVGWFGMPRGARISIKQAARLASVAKRLS